jgi:hypothetical protein
MASTGSGPYSRTRMRVYALAGVPSSLVVLVVGLVFLATGRPNALGIVIIGAVLTVVWSLMIPFALRRGRL